MKDKMKVICKFCGKEEYVTPSRYKKYSTCSRECLKLLQKGANNCSCDFCGKRFHKKPSEIAKYNLSFCSRKCMGKHMSLHMIGENNPSYKGREFDADGYKLDYIPNVGKIRVHHYITFKELNINKIPKGYNVHHRDCDLLHNTAFNLVLLNNSDHLWLHKQFGSAVLWAYCHNKIEKEKLIEWCNNPERANLLLDKTILDQKEEILEIKSREVGL